MRTSRGILAILAAVVVLGLVAGLAARASDVAPPAMPVEELARAMQAIQSAGSPDEAAKAYAKGCAITRRSASLQLTYLRRLLQLGRPDLAAAPAKELLALDANSGLAHGTLAYAQLRKKMYAHALAGAITAAVLEPTNPSICQNAAQLTAWYEAGTSPTPVASPSKASGRPKRPVVKPDILQAMKDLPSNSKAFAAAYKRAKDGFKGLDSISDDKKKLAADADKEAAAAEKEADALKKKLQSAGERYAQQQKRLNDAKREWDRANEDARSSASYDTRRSAEGRLRAAAGRVRSIQREMAKQETEGRKIRKEWETAVKEAKTKRAAAAKIVAEADALSQGMPSNFAWLAPAVDGVCTPDETIAKAGGTGGSPTAATGTGAAKPAAGGSYLLGGGTKATPVSVAPSTSIEQRLAEAEAGEKLELARLCLKSDTAAMKARARELLKEIVANYGSTTSAGPAKQLLGAMKE